MRLIGPNCLGLISPANRVVLTSSPALDIDRLIVGEIGLVSQSGALMATIFDRANDLGIGFAHCVSVGNQADLEAGDFIEYYIEDERTRDLQLHRGDQGPGARGRAGRAGAGGGQALADGQGRAAPPPGSAPPSRTRPAWPGVTPSSRRSRATTASC